MRQYHTGREGGEGKEGWEKGIRKKSKRRG
jgi:hypothetical protein